MLFAAPALSDRVVPSERVRSRVVVRELPKPGSQDVGSLSVGQEALLLESLPGWHRVALPGSREGFVSAAWTRIVDDPPTPPIELLPTERPNFVQRVAYTLSRAFGGGAPISIEVQEPRTERSFLRHPDPRLPVSGFAAAGEGGQMELILAIDASISTNEFSLADVDGDGTLKDE